MTTISDEFMQQMLSKTRQYCLVLLKTGPQANQEGVKKIVWEHGRRNFVLRSQGVLPIVGPISDGGDLEGLGIFNAPAAEVKKIMDEDPGVQAGIFVYEIYTFRSFPGDCLPEE